MALTITEILRAVNPNVGLVVNPDGTYRVGVEDVNSDEILAALGFIRGVPITTNTTGVGAAIATLAPGAAFKLLGFRFNVSTGAPLAAAETLTVTSDIGEGAEYDTILFTEDLGTPGTNVVVVDYADSKVYSFAAADSIVIALSANVGGDTWGCQTIHELI